MRAAPEFVQQRREYPHPGGADRVAERDSRAIHVQTLGVPPIPRLQDGQHLGGRTGRLKIDVLMLQVADWLAATSLRIDPLVAKLVTPATTQPDKRIIKE